MYIMTSYFYQIRFFTPNMIPLSTARFDPRWFHQNRDQKYQWKDKNGVWNGLRAEEFAPGPSCEGLCRGPECCSTGSPHLCKFLKEYRKQLDALDFKDIIKRIYKIGKAVQNAEGFTEDPIIVFIVHEATSNPCSERRVIQEWFADNGYPIREFTHKKNSMA